MLPGFEPGTFALSARRTTNCAIAPLYSFNFLLSSLFFTLCCCYLFSFFQGFCVLGTGCVLLCFGYLFVYSLYAFHTCNILSPNEVIEKYCANSWYTQQLKNVIKHFILFLITKAYNTFSTLVHMNT